MNVKTNKQPLPPRIIPPGALIEINIHEINIKAIVIQNELSPGGVRGFYGVAIPDFSIECDEPFFNFLLVPESEIEWECHATLFFKELL